MDIVKKLARKEIQTMKAYASARSTVPIDEMAKDNQQATIWLNANENPYNLYGEQKEENINRYPDPQPQKLRDLLAKFYQTQQERILMCRGSDEGIDCLIRLFCVAYEDSIIISTPTFGMYKIYAQTQGANVIDVPLKAEDNNVDFQSIITTAKEKSTKLVFITNPQAPLGHDLDPKDIEDLCVALSDTSLIVVDEAYIEFSQLKSMINLLDKYKNLVILRTMSKAFAMAGARLGTVVAHADIIKLLSVVQAPYPLSTGSIDTAINALSEQSLKIMGEHITLLNKERSIIFKALQDLSYVYKIYKTTTNFIMIQAKNANDLIDYMKKNGLVVRDFTAHITDGVRISVGTEEQNKILIEKLQAFS